MLYKIVTHSISNSTKHEFQQTMEYDDSSLDEIIENVIKGSESHEIYRVPTATTIIANYSTRTEVTVITLLSD